MSKGAEAVQIDRHEVKITRPDKVLFPEDGITKQELVDYYRRIAFWILPHLKERPLMLERYPDGIEGSRIVQKAASSYYPGWIRTSIVKKAGGTLRQVIGQDADTLAYLANQASITPHIWLSRVGRPDYPDQMIFDLDPSGKDFEPVKDTAHSLREKLTELGLPTFVKSTGSRGVHVTVPLRPDVDFDAVRSFAQRLAELVAEKIQSTGQPSSERANVADASFWIQTGMLIRKPPWHPMRFAPEQALRSRFRSAGVN